MPARPLGHAFDRVAELQQQVAMALMAHGDIQVVYSFDPELRPGAADPADFDDRAPNLI
jgi:hypothetical protein